MSKETIKEVGVATVKGGIGLIPIVGPLFSELIGVFTNKKSQQRFEKWASMVESRLERLEQKIDENNEMFYSAMVKTTQIVAKTHQDEKLEYLANALINSATSTLEEDKIQYFLELIERYTPSHIKTLKSYVSINDKNYYFKEGDNSNRGDIQELRKIYGSQLSGDGLIGFTNRRYGSDILLPLGEEFLSFILKQGVYNDNNEG